MMDQRTVDLQNQIAVICETATQWFFERSKEADRDQFFVKGGLGPDGIEAVYLYQDGEDAALCVGQTSRSIKARQHDQTYPEKNKPWWPKWKTVRYAHVINETDRLTLELLLVLSLAPKHNAKPGARKFEEMFV